MAPNKKEPPLDDPFLVGLSAFCMHPHPSKCLKTQGRGINNRMKYLTQFTFVLACVALLAIVARLRQSQAVRYSVVPVPISFTDEASARELLSLLRTLN